MSSIAEKQFSHEQPSLVNNILSENPEIRDHLLNLGIESPTLGTLTSELHKIDSPSNDPQFQTLWEKIILPHQSDFWEREYPRRDGKYESVATIPWGTREAVAELVKPKSGDLFIDIAGGPAPQAEHLVNASDGKIGIISIDNNPLAKPDAQKELHRLSNNLFHHSVITNSMDETITLPQEMPGEVETLRGLMVYGLYQPLHVFNEGTLKPFFEIGKERDLPTDFTLVVLNPNFDTDILKKKLFSQINSLPVSPIEKFKILVNFLKNSKGIIDHAKQVVQELPVWPPEEIIDFLSNSNPNLTFSETKILHGHTSVIQITSS